MTNIGKVFAIITTFLSLAFLGFAFASRIAGPNWDGEAAALENYYVERNVTDKETTYTVKAKLTKDAVKPNCKLLPDAIAAAYDHEATENNKKIEALSLLPAQLKTRLDEVLAHQQTDRKAMDQREQELKVEFDRLAKQIADLTVDADKVAQEALGVWNEGELRREDVARLRNHLEELEIDLFQAHEQKKRLQDELSRLNAVQARLQRRHVQLSSTTAYERDKP